MITEFKKSTSLIWKNAVLMLLLIFWSSVGCSIQKLAVGATSGIVDNAIEVLYENSDLEFAEDAIPGSIVLIDGLIRTDPKNKDVLLQGVGTYTGYALGFLEDLEDKERAINNYRKAKDYGLQMLSLDSKFKGKLNSSIAELESALDKADVSDVPYLFWAANAWGSYIKLNLANDVRAAADIGKVDAIMKRVTELDEDFYFGGAYMVLGVMEIERGIAGRPERAKEYFEKAMEISEGKFLLIPVLYARHYAVGMFDEELFDELLKKVVEAPDDHLPAFMLHNAIAKKKAKYYISMKDEWFN
ncbi:TRAP transporter TatT component family protein [candidate division KSB1 bacterium]